MFCQGENIGEEVHHCQCFHTGRAEARTLVTPSKKTRGVYPCPPPTARGGGHADDDQSLEGGDC